MIHIHFCAAKHNVILFELLLYDRHKLWTYVEFKMQWLYKVKIGDDGIPKSVNYADICICICNIYQILSENIRENP